MSVKQGPRCRVVGCSNQKKPVTPGTSLFLVPSHAETFEKWLQLTGNPELLDLPINFLRNNLRICEKHFLPDQVWVGTKHKLLKRGDSGPPVPSQFHEDHIPISDKEMLKWRLTEHYNKAVYNPMTSKKRKTESKDVIIRILQEDFITNEDGDQCVASEFSSSESADTAVHAAISPDEKAESNNVIIHIIQEDDLLNEGGGQSTALEFSSNESTADIAVHAAISPNERTESNNVIIRVLQEDFITDEEDQSRASEFSSNETSADVAVPFSLNDKTEEVNYTVLEDYITNGEESESRTQEPSPSEPSVDGAVHAATLIEEPEPVKPTGQKDCNTNEEGSQSKTSESSSSGGSSEWEPYYMLMPVGDQLMAIPCLSIQIPGMK